MSLFIADLPPAERAWRYRELAEETHAMAQRAECADVRAAYLELAGRWMALAESSERLAAVTDGASALRKPSSDAI